MNFKTDKFIKTVRRVTIREASDGKKTSSEPWFTRILA